MLTLILKFNYTETKEKQKGLPGSTVDWIIGVIIALAALIVLIVAIAIHRRRRARSQGLLSEIKSYFRKRFLLANINKW